MRRTLVPSLAFALLLVPAALHAQSARFAGLWEGNLHHGDGDRPVALTLRPRGPGLAGVVYFAGDAIGPVTDATIRGDSLVFHVSDIDFRGALQGAGLAFSAEVRNGSHFAFTLSRTDADTTALPASLAAADSARAPEAPRDRAPDSVYLAHALPPGTPPGTDPSLTRGWLVLVGGGPTQADILARFVKLAGGPSARVVVIPTALEPDRLARPGFLEQTRARLAQIIGVRDVTILHTFSRREADSEAFVAPLRSADAVWIEGGEGGQLLDAYLGTRTERELVGVLARGGVVGGTSAGALIFGSSTILYKPMEKGRVYDYAKDLEVVIGNPRGGGFGVLRSVLVAPHFDVFRQDRYMPRVLAAHPGVVGLGVDEATALVVHGDVFEVMGRGKASVYDGRPHGDSDHLVLAAGARYDLRQRSAL